MKKRGRGRPREYAGGTTRSTVSLPAKLHEEFTRTLQQLGARNYSAGVQEAVRHWMAYLGAGAGTDGHCTIMVRLTPEEREALGAMARRVDAPVSAYAERVLRDHIRGGGGP